MAKEVADPAFKVTIPCALHIAYLRWKVLKHMEEINRKDILKNANDNATSNSQLVVKRDSPLIIGEDADKPVLTFALAEISKHSPVNWQPVSELTTQELAVLIHYCKQFPAWSPRCMSLRRNM